ncbi:anthrax toxin lethal factor-related metalloendopeptidase [Lederbergia citrea]|uniref:Toxin n=1 Tax=Lederbergia citrea TaxID=2833581 RepID=A0A942Z488_9BACI|nr:toxin [Lederbergia citrea]MBS4176633.1 toxin [Lederbergia citrea]MBS4203194.1 toxin [Lederbergia citrea]MBS4222135.1 toxin [Lederbergia citrea]
MKKWIILPLLFIMVLYGSSFSKATYEGVLLNESGLYQRLQLTSGQLIKDIVVVPESDFNEYEASKIINRIDHLPVSILQEIKRNKIKVVLFEGKLTDNESVAHLKGRNPRGYPETIIWDDVPGIGGSKQIFVKIGSSEKGKGHGSVNLEYHEIAHSLHHYVYNDIDVDIKSVWELEAPILFPGQHYFLDYEEEYFAESFAYYFFSPETRNELKQHAPKTYTLLSRLY